MGAFKWQSGSMSQVIGSYLYVYLTNHIKGTFRLTHNLYAHMHKTIRIHDVIDKARICIKRNAL